MSKKQGIKQGITILRLGHRIARDRRTTTHAALVARAFGAEKIVLTVRDKSIAKTIEKVNESFGSGFAVGFVGSWKKFIEKWRSEGGIIVHLTMYGIPVREKIEQIKEAGKVKKMLVIIGAEKVPGEVYKIADFNVAIGNQPHSEISALAIFLDRYFEGRELERADKFKGKLQIVPSEKGKKVVKGERVVKGD